ncbi:DUF1294 domain-containing protein [Ottowia beijingensis]|jgi:uncharacterized membrane protein YsdA (DUF1294 family)/cold shock CspA family protein|uniref:DUF1294 domain-containing protein n=1 Tax=Ottowia beijingensis TaxID=1207057 RepID=UPI0036442FBE
MTRTGHIARWNAERGFGFIATPAGEQNIFFHVRDFRGGEPAEGLAVRFEQIEVGGKGPRAMAVQPLARAAAPSPAGPARTADRAANPQRRNGRAPSSAPRGLDGQPALFAIALLAWLGLLAAISLRGAWPWDLPVVLAGLLVLNIATFFSYALDKTAAAQGRWRTPESTLHALAAAGGWPAAWLAQRALRHKSRKREFLAVYVLTVGLHLGALGLLLWRSL